MQFCPAQQVSRTQNFPCEEILLRFDAHSSAIETMADTVPVRVKEASRPAGLGLIKCYLTLKVLHK